jgi:hypothetical protein
MKKLTHVLPRGPVTPAAQTEVPDQTPIVNLTSELTGITVSATYRAAHAPSSQPRGAGNAVWSI